MSVNCIFKHLLTSQYNPPNNIQKEIIALSRFVLDDKNNHTDNLYNAGFCYNFNPKTHYYEYYSLVNTTSPHASPISQNTYDVTLLRTVKEDKDYDIHINSHPLPLNQATKEVTSQAISMAVSQDIVMALAFVPAYIVLFLVKEREVGMKHQQIISGINIPAYWLSEFLWDTLVYCVVVVCELLLMWLFQMDDYLKDGKAPAVLLLFFLYGTASTSFVMCIQYMFKSHTIGLIVTLFINMLCVIMELASFIMTAIKDTCYTARVLNFVLFYLFPGFALGIGMMRISMLSAMYLLDQVCDYYYNGSINISQSTPEPFAFNGGIGYSLAYLACESVVYLIIAILLDYLTNDIKVKRWFSRHDVPIQRSVDVDEDVKREEDRVMASKDPGDDVIQLRQLRKVYNGEKVAVDRITFGLKRGQCFGLLGINGAGKTTTFSMISGENAPTKGTAILCGMDMLEEPVKVRRLLGMCPQTHALLDLLTVREHLELFGRIKGVPKEDLEDVILYRMEDMGIMQYADKKAYSLSGGNKRKLSVAQALIGNPPLVLMDEPSTGMDPVSRRALWDIISTVSARRKECTIIITTHSMEEAEALCTKVGIMVGGRLRCFGTIQDLKSKFGHGYTLNSKFYEATDEEVEKVKAELTVSKAMVTREEVKEVLACLDTADLMEEVSISGSGWVIDAELTKKGQVPLDVLVDWWITEVRFIDFMDFLEQRFASVELLERHGNLVTLRVNTKGMKLSEVFSFMEEVKVKCSIEEYSIAQMTLEQIFNFFASQQEEETREVQGMKKAK
ncbi:ATP-binding Cassette (ABC) Superfamily [Blastocystis sp. ATCC 50177/Nand II]|uniref:ATP-binding Cassette (ABC) Superfamily n=1 Tax=Blastocystis sp. subtype 1 (strain ATCC 50177 / NandII) TaxID=478820 RepID=A0A196SC66_BLAHN|nr:ATP-binding Cassette (ABC) Superfamily [Blastocystis sp. ATCC 50177/Nand II]